MTEEHNNSTEAFERITPAQVRPQAAGARQPAVRKSQGLPALVVCAIVGGVVALAVAAFWWLPQVMIAPEQSQKPPPTTAQNSPPPSAPVAAAPKQPDVENLLSQRQQAQTLQQTLQAQREKLAAKSAQTWAAQAHQEITALADQANQQFAGRDYSGAIKSYKQASAQAKALLQRADKVLADTLATAQQAYEAQNSKAATEAYTRALAIAPDNTQAKQGLVRAQSLDEVLAKMAAGRNHEQNNNLSAAADNYRAALKLDPAYSDAKASLGRVQSQINAQAFSQQMSRGLAALDRGDFAAAQTAFAAAQKIRPGDSSANDGLAQARQGLQAREIAQHQQAAETAEAQGNWQQALNEYEAALKLDSGLSFAQQGRARASARLKLTNALQAYLDNPQRLSDKAVRDAAEAQLAQARNVADPDSKLRDKVQQLTALVSAMRRPVPVKLVSDKRTQVLMYHVGELGSFDSKSLELTPGEYTVIGRCSGYRDVRRIVTVEPGAVSVGPINIRCEEKI